MMSLPSVLNISSIFTTNISPVHTVHSNTGSHITHCRYVKAYLLPDRSKKTKKKTSVKKGVDPIFNEVIKVGIFWNHQCEVMHIFVNVHTIELIG